MEQDNRYMANVVRDLCDRISSVQKQKASTIDTDLSLFKRNVNPCSFHGEGRAYDCISKGSVTLGKNSIAYGCNFGTGNIVIGDNCVLIGVVCMPFGVKGISCGDDSHNINIEDNCELYGVLLKTARMTIRKYSRLINCSITCTNVDIGEYALIASVVWTTVTKDDKTDIKPYSSNDTYNLAKIHVARLRIRDHACIYKMYVIMRNMGVVTLGSYCLIYPSWIFSVNEKDKNMFLKSYLTDRFAFHFNVNEHTIVLGAGNLYLAGDSQRYYNAYRRGKLSNLFYEFGDHLTISVANLDLILHKNLRIGSHVTIADTAEYIKATVNVQTANLSSYTQIYLQSSRHVYLNTLIMRQGASLVAVGHPTTSGEDSCLGIPEKGTCNFYI